jgi:hypothetical protein
VPNNTSVVLPGWKRCVARPRPIACAAARGGSTLSWIDGCRHQQTRLFGPATSFCRATRWRLQQLNFPGAAAWIPQYGPNALSAVLNQPYVKADRSRSCRLDLLPETRRFPASLFKQRVRPEARRQPAGMATCRDRFTARNAKGALRDFPAGAESGEPSGCSSSTTTSTRPNAPLNYSGRPACLAAAIFPGGWQGYGPGQPERARWSARLTFLPVCQHTFKITGVVAVAARDAPLIRSPPPISTTAADPLALVKQPRGLPAGADRTVATRSRRT